MAHNLKAVNFTPLKWELPHASLLVALNHDDFSAAWHYIVAWKQFPFLADFQHHGCLLFQVHPQIQSCHRRHPERTDRSQKGM